MPKPQRTGYQIEPVDRRQKTEMEIGSIYRVEFDTDETVIQCTMILCNRLQLEFFQAFERDCLRQGTRWFQMPLWIDGQQNKELEWYNCRFRERPKFSGLIGVTHITVTMKLEIERRELLDIAVMEILMLYGPDGLQGITRQLKNAIRAIGQLQPTSMHYEAWRKWDEFDAAMDIDVLAGVTNGPQA
jgi:hypothetical protein